MTDEPLSTTGPYYESAKDLVEEILGQLSYFYNSKNGKGKFKEFLDHFYSDLDNNPSISASSIIEKFTDEIKDGDKISILEKRFLTSVKMTVFFCSQANSFYQGGNTHFAMCNAAEANRWCGITSGIFFSVTAFEEELTMFAKSGARGRTEKYQPLRDFALREAVKRNYKSRRNAALSLKDEVIRLSKELGITLSEQQAEKTISSWLSELTFTGKRPRQLVKVSAS